MATENQKAAGLRIVKASEFKAKCLKLMDEVAESGEELVITKNGRPVSRLVPYRTKPKAPFGRDRGKIGIVGDMTAPTNAEWEAETNPYRVLNP